MSAFAAAMGVSSALSVLGQERANQSNRRIGNSQMRFQERMSSSAYQRGLLDMRKAGLNPMLAANTGGASSPGGAGPVMKNTLESATNTALQFQRAKAEVANIESQTALNDQNLKIKSVQGAIMGTAGDVVTRGISMGKNSISEYLNPPTRTPSSARSQWRADTKTKARSQRRSQRVKQRQRRKTLLDQSRDWRSRYLKQYRSKIQ